MCTYTVLNLKLRHCHYNYLQLYGKSLRTVCTCLRIYKVAVQPAVHQLSSQQFTPSSTSRKEYTELEKGRIVITE